MADSPQTVGDLVRAYLAEQATVLIDAEPVLREREPVIHATRVAARRLRSTLRTYDDVIDVARAGALEDELVWFAGLLGEVRDLEVLEARLLADLAELPAELVVGPGGRPDRDRADHPAQGGLGRRDRGAWTTTATGGCWPSCTAGAATPR